jgi:RNA recognition motif-containing protein
MHGILTELLDDEEAEVKNLAIEGFLANIHRFSTKNIDENMVGTVIGLLNELPSDSYHENIIINKLDDLIENSSLLRKLFVSEELWSKQPSLFHNKCLYKSSFFIETLGPDFFFENLYDEYKLLLKNEETKSEDELPPKWYITADIHNVVNNLGIVQCYEHEFEKNITYLMADKNMHSKGKLLENLHQIVEVLCVEQVTDEILESGIEKKINTFKATFMKNFLKIEESVKDNWRYLNLWIDCAYRILAKMHEIDPPAASQLDGTSTAVKKFVPIILNHLKKGCKATREL